MKQHSLTSISFSMFGLLLMFAVSTLSAQPTNDNFTNAIWLSGTDIITNVSNIKATREPGEPGLASASRPEFDSSVWWGWTAPADGLLQVSTAGSDFQTLLAIYIGSTLTGLSEVGYSGYGDSSMVSHVDVQVRSGVFYRIAVGGPNGQQGQITLHLTFWPRPPNDDFAARIDLGTNHSRVIGTNGAATMEPGEPHWDVVAKSVWWSWTASTSGPVTATAVGQPSPDALTDSPWIGLRVFTGSSLTSLTQVASQFDNSSLLISQVTIDAQAGTAYQLCVDGALGIPGAFTLNVAQTRPPFVMLTQPLDQGDFLSDAPVPCSAQAFDADGSVLSVDFRVTDQTYYPYRPIGIATSRPFQLDWTNPTISWHSLVALATNDLGAIGISLPVIFKVRPFNDDFERRVALSGSFLTVTGSNLGATVEPGEPASNDDSVWWSWTAPASGPVTLTTDGSFALGVYIGSSVSNLAQVAYNTSADGGYTTRSVFQAAAGGTYQIAVNRHWGEGGDFRLQIAQTLPATVVITSPTNGATFSPGRSITLEAQATNSDGTIAQVDFYQDFAWLVTVTNPPYSATLLLTDTTPVQHRLQAWATDIHNVTTRAAEVSYTVTPPGPVNDDFADRIAFTGASVTVTGSLAYATGEAGEPADLNNQSIWWSWVAPSNGTFTCTIVLPDFYPAIGIFTGDAVTNLSLVAYDASTGNDSSYSAQVTFEAAAGTTYVIGAAMNGGSPGGSYTLSMIAGSPPTVSISSPTNGETFTQGADITISADASDTYGAVSSVAFYNNSALLGVTTKPPFAIVVSNAPPMWYHVSAWATDSSGLVTRSQPVDFNVAGPTPQPPANDDFAQRIALTGSFITVTGSLVGATMAPSEPGACVWWTWTPPATDLFTITLKSDPGYYPALWVFTGGSLTNLTLATNSFFQGLDNTYSTRVILPAVAGTPYQIAVASTPEAGYSLSVAESLPPSVTISSPTNDATLTGLDSVTFIAEASDADGTVPRVDFFLDYQLLGSVTNPPYSIVYILQNHLPLNHTLWAAATDGHGLSTISSSVSFLSNPPPPPNDAFTNRIQLSGFFATVEGSIGGATWEPGEADSIANPSGGSAWWTWQAPASGTVILTVQGYDSTLQVFTGSDLVHLKRVDTETANSAPNYQLTFSADSGEIYQLAGERTGPNADVLDFTLVLQAQQFTGVEQLETGDVRLGFAATPGPTWVLEASPDLTHWSSIDTNATSSGLLQFVDRQPPRFPQRFYRARQE